MKLFRPNRNHAMTLMELLIVIAIMVIVAGLVVGLAGVASEKGKISRAQAERDKLVMLIETYRAKVGVYPPDNQQIPFNSDMNPLVYELAGAYCTNRLDTYETLFGNVTSNDLFNAFGIRGLVNASEDATEIKRIMKRFKPDEAATVATKTLGFVFPVDGPNGTPNKWHYAKGTNAVHNPEAFDLWVEIVVRNKTNIIGNWKD